MIMTVLSTLLGVSVGATVTSFVSNYSGKERRERWQNEVQEDVKKAEAVKASAQRVNQASATLKQTMNDILPTFKQDMDEWMTEAKFQLTPRVERVNRALKQLEDDLPK